MSELKDRITDFLLLYDQAEATLNVDIDWKIKFEVIFGLVTEAQKYYAFDWYDPDTTYEADVRAVMTVWSGLADNFRKLGKELVKEVVSYPSET